MENRKPFLSIVIPAYKEGVRLRRTLPDFLRFASSFKLPVELIFVDDGSPDDTSQVIQPVIQGLPNARLVRLSPNQGKGAAVRAGMLSARGDFRLFTDADNSTDIPQVNKLLKVADEKTIVIGSRYIHGALLKRKQPFYRVAGGRILNLFIQLFLLPGIRDTQCGFKLFPRRAAEQIFPKLRLTRFSFDLEVLALAKEFGYRIREVPVEWEDDPHSAVHPVKDGLALLQDVIRIKISLIKGEYISERQ